MNPDLETLTIDFLRKNSDMFAWSPSDFQGIDLEKGILPDDPIRAKRVQFKANRSGVLRILISDNGAQFQGKKIVAWCKELKIQQHFTVVGNPQANSQTEVTNRILLQHLKTRLDGAKGSWVEELSGVLWAYRTTPRSATGETPFCLVYGSEAIIQRRLGKKRLG
ncbi:UNVERIFIED_CONTAM: hypothetical protein Sradi_0710300 [Sesamum radiatum]|uniref:Integrase catalytic domain-containing protein n=1 Tax=Sesamum radiatum TaxID=300843 RepID=A0AAW2VNG8_SESRA